MGSIADVKHVVILMQENRPFDQYFGTMRGVRGFFDPAAIKQADGTSIFAQKNPRSPNPLYPFHKDARTTNAETVPGNAHSWSNQHIAWDSGKMDAWLTAQSKNTCMAYFTEQDIPFHFALAQTFTLCDGYHCSVLGPTAPNRIYLMSGMIDPTGAKGGPATDNPLGQPDPAHPLFHWKSYPEQLAAAGVDWAVYDEETNQDAKVFDLNVAAYFSGWPAALKATPNGLRSGHHKFELDLANNNLPRVSWIVPPFEYTEHPSYAPADGAYWVSQKIKALINSPCWDSTVFILVYDENDGAFDHVPPPTSPTGTADEWVTSGTDQGCIGPGFRVPCIVVSPWTVGGRVCNTKFDHTSVLRLLETVTGVTAENISAYRRQTLGDLSTVLDFSSAVAGASVPALPHTMTYAPPNPPLPTPVPPSPQVFPPNLSRLSAVCWPGSHVYFFKGANYSRYTTGTVNATQHPDAGYPKPIAGHWPELTSVDAGLVMPDGKAYLFKDNSYVRYSGPSDHPNADAGDYTPDPGYPKQIWKEWPKFWASDLDAAVTWPTGKTYFFKGQEYLRCSTNAHTPDAGYPKTILGNWDGLGEAFPDGIDAAVVWSDDKAYFFKGDKYVRFTIGSNGNATMDHGYPLPISDFSPELAHL